MGPGEPRVPNPLEFWARRYGVLADGAAAEAGAPAGGGGQVAQPRPIAPPPPRPAGMAVPALHHPPPPPHGAVNRQAAAAAAAGYGNYEPDVQMWPPAMPHPRPRAYPLPRGMLGQALF